ncbi:MAG: hypothetical protein M3N97_11850 [Pseudomonadota bacterium]|nr:hypothetical protein [Pseudomonadota bacterium]
MRTAVEISMYPLAGDYRPLIQAFIDRLSTYPELEVLTNPLSTQIWGPLDRVMAILAEEMRRAAAGPQPIFVMKVLPGVDRPGEVAAGAAGAGETTTAPRGGGPGSERP